VRNTLAALKREWETSVQPLKKSSVANENKYSSAAYPNGMMNFMLPLVICFQIPKKKQGGALSFKGSHRNGDRPIFLKTSAPHSLMTRRSIWLESALIILWKYPKHEGK
jgi:hypothetical protein